MERRYSYGVTLVIIGGLFLSLSGILLRNLESASGWQILFYRSISLTAFLFVVIVLRTRENPFRLVLQAGFPAVFLLDNTRGEVVHVGGANLSVHDLERAVDDYL